MGYPQVTVTNSTNFKATGEVRYASAFCSNDDYSVDALATWTGPGRGVCLVTEISAIVQTPNGNVAAQPYKSSGTSYSQYAVIQLNATTFEVTRRVSLVPEEDVPADYVEPTEKQK